MIGLLAFLRGGIIPSSTFAFELALTCHEFMLAYSHAQHQKKYRAPLNDSKCLRESVFCVQQSSWTVIKSLQHAAVLKPLVLLICPQEKCRYPCAAVDLFCNLCRHQAFDERDNVLVHDPSDLRSRRVVLPLRADMWCCDTQTFISATLFHLICMDLFSANLHSFIFWDNYPFHPFWRQSAQWMRFTMILWVFDFLPNVWS